MKHLSVKFMEVIVKALDGKFGNKVLRQPYRNYYRLAILAILTVLTWKYIIVPFFGFWNKGIYVINHLIWS